MRLACWAPAFPLACGGLVEGLEADGEAAAAGHVHRENGGGVDVAGSDRVSFGVGGIIGVGSVSVDGGAVFAAGFEEVEAELIVAGIAVGHAARIPVVAVLVLTGHDDKFSGLGVEIFALVPVNGHILDKLKGIHLLGIVLRKVGGHLEGRVHGQV